MNKNNLSAGFSFAVDRKLTTKDQEILLHTLKKDFVCKDLAKALSMETNQMYGALKKLQYKGVIIMKTVEGKREKVYSFNDALLK